ncbi:MAG TPA: GAF domain-containing protein [Streptosporangiaceae bacterium]|jgi:signal transduction histidine kinase|nr:GAF domain-containing protein [Streptosporangiaceae bacterium]
MERWESLLEELRQEFVLREEELELLHDIDVQLLRSERPINATFDFIISRTEQLLKSDSTYILLRRGRHLDAAYSTDESLITRRVAIGSSLAGSSITTMSTVNVGDVTQHPYAGMYAAGTGDSRHRSRSLLAAPIKVQDTIVGVLSAESGRLNAFSDMHERIITAIAAQVAIALQRVQLFDQKELFSEVDALIFAAGESQQVIPAALQKVIDALYELEHIQLSIAQILFIRGRDELEVVYSTNPSEVGLTVKIDRSISGRAVRELKTIVIGDVSTEPEYRKQLRSATGSELAIPILLWSSEVAIGVLNIESEEPEAFEGFCQVVLESFADKVQTLLAFAKLRTDVTEAMELRTANDLLVAVGDQASNMIHRMNNTVGAMRLRILELQDLDDAGELGDGTFLAESLAALRKLAEQTLELPEEVGRLLNQQGVTVQVNDVVRAVLEKFDIPDNVSVHLSLDPGVRALSLYSFDIVVQNLIQNALDAMPYGGSLTICTRSVYDSETDSGYIDLIVGDTGGGIAEDVLPKIFFLNFTTKHSKGKGHGLGLWWIRNFVLRAKGDITVTSSLGNGAEFLVKIPFGRFPADMTAADNADRHREA